MIEQQLGVPTMVVTRQGFTQVVANAFAGVGFSTEGPSVMEFPMMMFVPGSDLSPLNENIDKIVYGLTKWQPQVKAKGVYAAPKVTAKGTDYPEAVANLNLLFLKNSWSDALPLLPATPKSVDWILTGTDLARDKVVGNGKILPRGGIATVESLAVALAMAGGRPEYLPVVIAAVEAITNPVSDHQGWNATTCSVYPAVVVNGPVAKQIRLNSGYGLLGPHPLYPAGGSIGRAIRLILLNLGGAVPGVGTMSIFGANRHTNIVYAEDEEGIPSTWEPFSASFWGLPKGSNIVTVHQVQTAGNSSSCTTSTKELSLAHMYRWAAFLSVPHSHYWNTFAPRRIAATLLVARGTAAQLSDNGWTKKKMQEFLWTNSKMPWSVMENIGWQDKADAAKTPRGQPVPITLGPDNIAIIVAGGSQSGHSFVFHTGWGGAEATKGEIKLPAKAKWDALLAQAEKDLGPIPSA